MKINSNLFSRYVQMIGGFDVIDIFVRMTHLPQIDSCFHERFVRCP